LERKWHILKEDNQRPELQKEELTIKQSLRHWLFVRIAANGMSITPYVVLAGITEVNLP
jgi:hypothetical protein